MTDRDLIQMHLEDYLQEIQPFKHKPAWFDVLAFCEGYYGKITLDMVMVVREFQREGKVE